MDLCIDNIMRLNETGGQPDSCSSCKIGYLTGEVVVKGESAGEYRNIGTRRVFKCDNCEQRQVIVGHQEYVRIGDEVKTIFIEDKS
jgi:DNA-directed RNA polymerase subunit M/transcription elongation factor TFIIS